MITVVWIDSREGGVCLWCVHVRAPGMFKAWKRDEDRGGVECMGLEGEYRDLGMSV